MNLTKVIGHCSEVIDRGRFVQATRPDGLEVFFDKADDPISLWLNKIRADGDRHTVFLAVGLARGLAIAMNYTERYGNADDRHCIQTQIESLISNRLLTAE